MALNQRQLQLHYSKKDLRRINSRKFSRLEESDINLVYPGVDTTFKLILLARFCSAIWRHITDCDETYNYWEPSHYLLYGSGQQTWEYSPQYALRSYTYLLLHMVPAKLYHYLLEPNPILIFYFVRCLLAVCCALTEVYFYTNVCREFGIHIARLMLAFLIPSAGMFIASSAFLPSSFSMYFSTLAIGAWYDRKYELAIFATAISSLLGWPFAALLGLPIAVEMLFRRQEWSKFIKWVVISAVVILVPMIWIDSIYYRRFVLAPLNIIIYNVFTSHGPDLYGTEPFSYYIVNGFLNFNFVFLAALITPFAVFLAWFFIPAKPRDQLYLPYWYSLAPLYLWFSIFFLQAHKEERFLFPVYPMICLAGAITVDVFQKLYFFIGTKIFSLHVGRHYSQYTTHITISAIIVCGFLGLSRTLALYKGYYAPMEIMIETNRLGSENEILRDININFCVGKDWHRFPSSFFFPSNKWKLQYIKSEFKGQLPQSYSDHENATSIIQPYFNDLNMEETSRYILIDKCHFLLDLDISVETELEPNYSQLSNRFVIVKSSKFLDTSRSHSFFRAFYVPFGSHKFCIYGSFNLLQNIKTILTIPLLTQGTSRTS